MSKLNIPLIKQAVLAKEANRRAATSSTKTRGEVRGGGKKPFKQKGTGSARAGTRRSPIWVGGGIVFGPNKNRTYKQQLPKKMARRALEQVLESLNDDKKIIIADKLELAQPKTKLIIDLLAKHNISANKVILVTEKIQPELVLASRNLPGVKVVLNQDLSILDAVNTGEILIDKASAITRGLIKSEAKPKTSKAKKATVKEAK
ncbi:MAG TPA: 50S ribosomal protein L4 [Candidatus Saccharimonadales bacterium]|nr:50S ribosomal protein L4 [Candidatus Saccharimonadales bacterium]